MVEVLFPTRTLPLLEKVAAFAERRNEVLAGNIANITTPGYRARDLPVSEFQQALQQAIEARQSPAEVSPGVAMWQTQTATPVSLDELFPRDLFQAVERKPGDLTFQDGNNRSVENEVMELTKNSLMQNFAIDLMVTQMNLLQSVISERP